MTARGRRQVEYLDHAMRKGWSHHHTLRQASTTQHDHEVCDNLVIIKSPARRLSADVEGIGVAGWTDDLATLHVVVFMLPLADYRPHFLQTSPPQGPSTKV